MQLLWVMSGDVIEQTLTSVSPTFNFNLVGKKNIKLVASSNLCKDSVSKSNIITVTAAGQSGITNSKTSKITVFLNPMNDKVNVDLTDLNSDVSISIYNLVGVKQTQKIVKSANGIVEMSVSNLPSGNYLMVITLENETRTFKVTKE